MLFKNAFHFVPFIPFVPFRSIHSIRSTFQNAFHERCVCCVERIQVVLSGQVPNMACGGMTMGKSHVCVDIYKYTLIACKIQEEVRREPRWFIWHDFDRPRKIATRDARSARHGEKA